MKLKSYFSGTVEAAVELARKELGGDALLVHARPATPETRSLGAFEVVFGVPGPVPAEAAWTGGAGREANGPSETGRGAALALNGPSEPEQLTGGPDLLPSQSRRDPELRRLADDVAGLRREIERMAEALRGTRLLQTPSPTPQTELYARLVEAELDPELAVQVAEGRPLEDLFTADSRLGRAGASRAIVALVGPPGAGKTTTLIKLAARYGLTSRRPARILTADVFRIAAADQLRSLASILGIGCDVVETPGALAQAIEEHRAKEFLFIDTPGFARGEMEDAADLARLLATHTEIDTHLVLAASMKPADLSRAADRFAPFAPRKLLFTRMDETAHYGPLINESSRRALPLSFLAGGPSIPDDLQAATRERVAALVGVARPQPKTAGAAA